MKYNPDEYYITELLLRLFEGRVSDLDIQALKDWLEKDPQAQSKYVKFVKDYTAIKLYSEMHGVSQQNNESPVEGFSDNIWRVLSDMERTAPPVEIPEEIPQQQMPVKVLYPPQNKRRLSKLDRFSFIASAAVILFFVYLSFTSPKPSSVEVATLIDQMDVKWDGSAVDLENGDRLYTNGGLLSLKKGFISIAYDQGVDVVIESPSSFEIEPSGLYLEYGRLYVKVSKTGLGFTVKTPTSQFVDQGTEFGVKADIDGSSELHVMKGKVQLFFGLQGKVPASQMVTEKKAVRYNAMNGQTGMLPLEQTSFVRRINSKINLIWRGQTKIDLADIVSGGNGFGTTLKPVYIDPLTGSTSSESPIRNTKNGDFTYHAVVDNDLIDGVFIPCGEKGSVQITSEGHVFDCPTTENLFFAGIFNTQYCETNANKLKSILAYVKDFRQPAIYLHSNSGITFDLNKIRAANPLISINEFRSGCLHNAPTDPDDEFKGTADFWVLIDGQLRYQKKAVSQSETIYPVKIDISEKDRFLTLIVTDGIEQKNSRDWAFFVNPELIAIDN
jgi:hypothetical protein